VLDLVSHFSGANSHGVPPPPPSYPSGLHGDCSCSESDSGSGSDTTCSSMPGLVCPKCGQ
jgi:hypothetical protein